MLKNYLTIAIRNMLRHKLYTFINVGGLSIGLAACILIFLFVENELSYDKWLTDSDRIYRLEGKYIGTKGDADNPMALSPGALSKPLKANFSSEIVASTRMLDEDFLITYGDTKYLEVIDLIDNTFFDVFDLPIVEGDRSLAFQDYLSIIISESMAKKYFGDTSPIGEVLDLDYGTQLVKVVAVMKDLPTNSHLRADFFLNFDESRYENRPWVLKWWISSNVYTYLKLGSSAQKGQLEAAIPAFLDKNAVMHPASSPDAIPSEIYQTNLMPVADIHLYSKGRFQQKATGDIVIVYSFSAIAALILVIAVINFTNLSTARASLRAREIALRKVVGASRKQIILQFLGETLLTTLIALLLAFVIVEVALPWFNQFVTKLLNLAVFTDPAVQLGLVGVTAVIGLSAGAHPALQISRYRPAIILHSSNAATSGSAKLRGALTTLQFTISIGLMIATAVIYSQVKYAQSLDGGLEKDGKLILRNMDYGPVAAAAETVRNEIAKLPGVKATAFAARGLPLRGFWDWPIKVGVGDAARTTEIETMPADFEFLQFYNAELIAGRLFSPERRGDLLQQPSDGGQETQAGIINLKAVQHLGFASPEDALGKTTYFTQPDGTDRATTIVGVVADMHMRSARDTVDPTMFLVQENDMSTLTVDLHAENRTETVQSIASLWNRVVPDFPLSQSFVEDNFNQFYQADQQRAEMFAYFSLFAILVSCLGLYGLASFTAERRTKEIGIRKVLGAKVRNIVSLLTLQFSKPVLVANLIAWPVAWYFTNQWLQGFVYRIDLSLMYFIFAGALAMAVACATVAGHAFRTANANPISALRHE